MQAQGFLDLLLMLPPLLNIITVFELNTKAAFAKSRFDTLRHKSWPMGGMNIGESLGLLHTWAWQHSKVLCCGLVQSHAMETDSPIACHILLQQVAHKPHNQPKARHQRTKQIFATIGCIHSPSALAIRSSLASGLMWIFESPRARGDQNLGVMNSDGFWEKFWWVILNIQ